MYIVFFTDHNIMDLIPLAVLAAAGGVVVGQAAKEHHMKKNGMVQKRVPYISRTGKTKYKWIWVPERKVPEKATVSKKGQRANAKTARRTHKRMSQRINKSKRSRRSRRRR